MNDRLDRDSLLHACRLAEQGTRATAPNPRVGAVLMRAAEAVGEGWHQRAGEDHAEVIALRAAGDRARGATLYVTLEPCAHSGRTPPCVDAIRAAGVTRVVIGVSDPDPRVRGAGIEALRAAGLRVDVAVGDAADAAALVIEDYLVHRRAQRSFVVIKVAATLDGRIADRWRQARWITNESARAWGRSLRDRYGAILVGAGTVIADDPELQPPTAPPEGGSFLRCVIDGALRIPPGAKLMRTASTSPVLIVTARGSSLDRRRQLEAAGAEVLELDSQAGLVDPAAVAAELGRRGVLGVVIEGGGQTHARFLQRGLVDKMHWILAPRLLGDADAVGAVDGGARPLEAAWPMRIAGVERLGDDLALTLYPRRAPQQFEPEPQRREG